MHLVLKLFKEASLRTMKGATILLLMASALVLQDVKGINLKFRITMYFAITKI